MTRGQRITITAIWWVIQLVVLLLLMFGCAFAATAIGPDYPPLGFAVGMLLTICLCHYARMCLLRLRLRGLRRSGAQEVATVTRLSRERLYYTRIIVTRYTVTVSWTDPDTGTEHDLERQYNFGRRSTTFERACAKRKKVTVRYRQRHPSRFVLDIPFAPSMADLIR